jgi:hypothetical protein
MRGGGENTRSGWTGEGDAGRDDIARRRAIHLNDPFKRDGKRQKGLVPEQKSAAGTVMRLSPVSRDSGC